MAGYILKDIKLAIGSTTTTEPFKLPAENRMATVLSITAATTPVLQHSLDGSSWSNVSGITLADGITGWNLYNSSTKAPLPLVRITSSSVAEVTKFTFSQAGSFYDVAGAAKALQLYTAAGAGHYFYFTVSDGPNTQTDPALTGTGHEVVVAMADTSAQVATAFHTAVNLVTGVYTSTNSVASEVNVTNTTAGAVTNATASGTAAAITVTTAGVTAEISDIKLALVE
jgi:hypothetical protein